MESEGSARPGIVIRPFDGGTDSGKVAEILREAREAATWSEEALRETAQLLGVVAFVSEDEGAISGIVVGRQVLDEAEILNLAVTRGARRRGTGRALVAGILDRFEKLHVSRVFLEVRESNTGAIAFYRGLGFQPIGVRRDYYHDPKESATVMELWLRESSS